MSIPKILGKRKCSFKPTSTVRALLAELDSLLNLLEKNVSIEDFINEALQSYLPDVILIFKQELYNKNKMEEVLNNISKKINSIDSSNIKIDYDNEDENNEEYEKNFDIVNLKDRFQF